MLLLPNGILAQVLPKKAGSKKSHDHKKKEHLAQNAIETLKNLSQKLSGLQNQAQVEDRKFLVQQSELHSRKMLAAVDKINRTLKLGQTMGPEDKQLAQGLMAAHEVAMKALAQNAQMLKMLPTTPGKKKTSAKKKAKTAAKPLPISSMRNGKPDIQSC